MATTCFQVTKLKDRLLRKRLPNRIQSASHSDPSSHQTLQSICLSHALLVNRHLFYLGACGAQLAQLAGRRDASSRQPPEQRQRALAAIPAQSQATCPTPASLGAQPQQRAHLWQMHRGWAGEAGCLHSPCGFKVPPQLSSVTAEPCFALRLTLAPGLGTEY